MNQHRDNIDQLLADYCSGALTSGEAKVLRNWIDEADENREKALKFIMLYREGRELSFLSQYDKNKAWTIIEYQLNVKKRRILQTWSGVAAVFVIALLSSLFIWVYNPPKIETSGTIAQIAKPGHPKAYLTLANGEQIDLEGKSNLIITEKYGNVIKKDSTDKISYESSGEPTQEIIYNTINVPRGGEYNLVLNDGTQVWLNSETEMRFPVNFIGQKREITLTGEAYFEVAHNADQPFVVNLEAGCVEVLGTSFNVSAYPTDDYVATTLIAGSVLVVSDSESTTIEPGIQAVFQTTDTKITTQSVQTSLYTSWVNGVFEFENADLQYICQRLSRWYSVEFEFFDEEIKNLHFTGAAKRTDSIEKIIKMIEKTTSVKFEADRNRIKIGRE